MLLNNTDKENINKLLDKIECSGFNGLSEYEDLWNLCTPESKSLVNKILKLNPYDYGFRGKEILPTKIPKDAVKIDIKTGSISGEYAIDKSTYLPKTVFKAFSEMAKNFANDHPNRKLLVGSGYRSPALQIATILYILAKIYDFNLGQTLKRAALPNYSQHCSSTDTALDMLNINGEPSDDNPQEFSNSIEYKWLQQNANKYRFYESYPPNNSDGIMWEPWHWQYRS